MKLPALTGKQIVEILKKAGFEEVRQKDSHVFLKYPDTSGEKLFKQPRLPEKTILNSITLKVSK